jgi:hypothetical protein
MTTFSKPKSQLDRAREEASFHLACAGIDSSRVPIDGVDADGYWRWADVGEDLAGREVDRSGTAARVREAWPELAHVDQILKAAAEVRALTGEPGYEFQVLSPEQVDAIRSLQSFIGAANAEKGFHDEGKQLLHLEKARANAWAGREPEKPTLIPSAIRAYWTARLSLITTEVAEAIEELRNGHAVDETWYTGAAGDQSAPDVHLLETDPRGLPRKPEGVPSEVADVVVRSFDFADEAKFDLAEILDRKLAYNASRPKMHGRKF